jgi:nucleoside-diphosphate-sugar epimerase
LQFATTLQSNEPPILVGDNRRLKNEVNWTPLFDLDNGIAQTIEWWKIQTLKQQIEIQSRSYKIIS